MQQRPRFQEDAGQKIRLPGLCLLACLGLAVTGCQSFNSPPTAGSLTSVTIKGKTVPQIAAATQAVFDNHYFHGGVTAPGQLTFERPGSRMNDLAYGGGMFHETVTIRVVVRVAKLDSQSTLLSCNAWLVEDADDPVFEDNHKVRMLRKWPYEDLLKDIQKQLGE